MNFSYFRAVPIVVAVWIFGGCGDDGGGGDADVEDVPCIDGVQTVPLVSVDAWELTENHPFVDDRPEPMDCDPDGIIAEDFGGGTTAIEIDTTLCNGGAVFQPLRDDVAAGQTLGPGAFYFELTGPESEARMALAIGDTIVLDERIDIPGPAGTVIQRIESQRDFSAGTPVTFFVRNHGENQYALSRLVVERSCTE